MKNRLEVYVKNVGEGRESQTYVKVIDVRPALLSTLKNAFLAFGYVALNN